MSSSKILRSISTTYIEVIRGTPELLQIFLIYFGLAQYGIRIPPLPSAVLWLGIFGGAYVTEIFRAGIQSVGEGQFEAGRALGLSRISLMRRVVLPQAILSILPPLANFFILQIKASSMAYLIGVQEIMGEAKIASLGSFRTMEIYLLAAVIYFFLCYPMSKLVARVELFTKKFR